MAATRKAIGASRPEPHNPALDGVRGVAVLMVLFLHFSTPLQFSDDGVVRIVRALMQQGWMGVDLFFALSGFLITGILLRAKGEVGYFRTFYARRVLRIFPLYYLIIGAYFLLAWRVAGAEHHVPVNEQLWYWSFLGNFRRVDQPMGGVVGHLWSLAIEEQFYLVWPALIFLCTPRQAFVASVTVMLGALAFRGFAFMSGADGWLVYHYTLGRLDGLACGAIVAIAVAMPGARATLSRWCVPVLCAAALGLIALPAIPGVLVPTGGNAMMTYGYSLIAIASGAIVAYCATRASSSAVPRLLAAAPLRIFGKFSFAIYVLHPLLLLVARHLHAIPDARMLAAHPIAWLIGFTGVMSALSLAVGWVCWHACEKHFLTLKRHFSYGRVERRRTMRGRGATLFGDEESVERAG